MRRWIHGFLWVPIFWLGASAALAQAPLAERHAGRGIPCQGCHSIAAPTAGAEVATATCQTCHGDYLSLRQRTVRYGKDNPHGNHLGEVDCTVCHRGHSRSDSYCKSCHQDLTHAME